MSKEDLVLLSASPNAGAGTVEGSAFKARIGGSDAWAKHHKRKGRD